MGANLSASVVKRGKKNWEKYFFIVGRI